MRTTSRGKSEMNMFMKWMTLLLSVVTLGLAGCGESDKFYGSTGGSVTPGANNTISVAALQSSIVVGTTTQITALLVDENQAPVEGGNVTFLVDNGSFTGGLKTTTAVTDASGLATVVLTAPVKVGTGSVDAQYAESSASVSMNYIVGAINRIYLDASPGAVGVSSQSTLSALVIDAYGNPLVNEAMQFAVSANNSGSPGIDLGGIVQTNASGIATAIYTSGVTVDVIDTVTVGQLINPTVTASRNISVLSSATAISSLNIALSSASTAITVGTDSASASPVSVVATVLDDTGAGVNGVSVSFQLVGTGDFGGLKSKTALTDVNGIASVVLDAPILIGSATITAATAGLTTSTNVTYIPDVPDAVTLSASPSTVGVSTASTLTAVLYDQYGNITPNEPVNFSITVNASVGAVLSNPTGNAQTNASGIATMTYTSGTTTGVTDTVRVAALNGSTPFKTADIDVSASATAITSLDLALSSPTTAITVGSNTVTADATILDSLGSPIAGVDVAFQIVGTGDFGGLKTVIATTNTSGVASATLNAPILIGSATITAASSGLSSNISITYIPDVPFAVTLSASPATVGVSSASSLTAGVYDQYGNVTPNEPVTFSITVNASVGAELSNPTGNAQTNASGIATMTYTSGTTIGVTDTVKVAAVNGSTPFKTADIDVSAAATSISSLDLALSSPTTSITVGTNTVTADATILDNLGNPIAGVEVAFQLVGLGDFGGSKLVTAATNASGVATVTLTASKLVGTATINVSAAGLTDSVSLSYIPDVPSTMVVTATPSTVGEAGESTLTATVKDQYGNVTPDEPVSFAITTVDSVGASLSATYGTTNSSGVASVVYTGGTVNIAGTPDIDAVTVTATSVAAPVIAATVNVAVDDTAGATIPAKMSIRTDRATIPSDSSEAATITVTVLDAGNVVVPGTTVTFVATGGTLSLGAVATDENGQATVTLNAGSDPSNHTITVTASSSGISDVILPVDVVGTTVAISASRDVLITDGLNTSSLTIKVTDASGQGVYGVAVTLSLDNGAVASLNPLSGTTGVSGEFTTTLTGNLAGTVVVTAAAAGAVVTYSFTVDTTADSLLITFPQSGTTAGIDTTQIITVDIPDTVASVTLVTTMGTWDIDGNVSNVTTIANPSFGVGGVESVDRGLTATEVGTATVRVTDSSNTSLTDEIRLVFVDETVDTDSTISLQASPTTVAPSEGATLNSSLLSVAVRNAGGTGIANAMVTFSLSNTTGSGEYISPPVAYTDSSGTATASFYSGSASSGGEGVIVTAALDKSLTTTLVSDSVPIIVNGTAGSITIGASTTVAAIYSNTMYELPMSLLVTDAGGNPVADTAVTLNLWPEKYATGYWYCEPEPGLWQENVVLNEDVNRNLVLDEADSEDISGNGAMTPLVSDAGSVPTIVTTDENGVATFALQYAKESAGFIYNALSASTLVQGTETRATKRFWLGASESDITGCFLGGSPYNSHWPSLTSSAGLATLLVGEGTTITANLTDSMGAPMAAETIDAVFLSRGTNDYDPVAMTGTAPTLTPASADTDVDGNVSFAYTSGGLAGTDQIKISHTIGSVVITNYIDIVVE